MKKLPFFLFFSFLFSLTSIHLDAQPECSGIYLTANDFMLGKYYYAIASKSFSKDSYFNLLATTHFIIFQSGYVRSIEKEDVFAIKGCDGQIIRIYEGINYTLLNPGEDIPIYKAVLNPVSKGNIMRVKYCFSRNLVSEMMDLTIDNLKSVFAEDSKFVDAIDTYFKYNSDLYNFNKRFKCFDLNLIYNSNRL